MSFTHNANKRKLSARDKRKQNTGVVPPRLSPTSSNEKTIMTMLTEQSKQQDKPKYRVPAISQGNPEYAEAIVDTATTENKTMTEAEIQANIDKVFPPKDADKKAQEEVEKTTSAVDKELSDLFEILSYQRGCDSKGEEAFIKDFIECIPNIKKDNFGNYYLTIGENPNVLWSAHTDTVHKQNTPNGRQSLAIDEHGLLSVRATKFQDGEGKEIIVNPNCLGADNGVGCWILLRLIKANKPGLYVFHRKEEVGRRGSISFAASHKELLKGIKYAIAFDRRRIASIITYQGATRTCSDNFAKSLAKELEMGHEPDNTGLFTDTKSYEDVIPECTNVSAGFYDEHTANEYLDTKYAKELVAKVIALDMDKLVCERDPNKKDSKYTSHYSGNYGNGGNYQQQQQKTQQQIQSNIKKRRHYENFADWRARRAMKNKEKHVPLTSYDDYFPDGHGENFTEEYMEYLEKVKMEAIIEYNSDVVAELLLDSGVTIEKLRQVIRQTRTQGAW